jgi:hypothetical protein
MKKIFIIFLTSIVVSCSNAPSDFKNISNETKYEILKEEKYAGGKTIEETIKMQEAGITNLCKLQIKLNEKLNKNSLQDIAVKLRKNREDYEKLWISFYLPDLLPDKSGNGAWAVANFTPDLEVTILGENVSAEQLKNIPFPKYAKVMEMLEEAGDYKKNDGCLILLSKDGKPLHIQVSQQFLNDEPDKNIKEEVKRDIVYIAFQTFAETDIDKITITSVPIKRSSFNPNDKKDAKTVKAFQKTVTIDRLTAMKILEKYLKGSSLQDLYQLDGTLYVPSAKFERLQFAELENVYSELEKE